MLRWVPLLVLATAGMFFWFTVAFFSDNNTEWWTSEPVQIATGIGTLAGAFAVLLVPIPALRRWWRSRRNT